MLALNHTMHPALCQSTLQPTGWSLSVGVASTLGSSVCDTWPAWGGGLNCAERGCRLMTRVDLKSRVLDQACVRDFERPAAGVTRMVLTLCWKAELSADHQWVRQRVCSSNQFIPMFYMGLY